MPGPRGRKNVPHPHYPPRQNYPRWPNHQQHYYDPSFQRGWANDSWNVAQGFNAWPGNNANMWPQDQYHHSGHQRPGGDPYQYDQFPQRFTNAYNPPYAHFEERSLAHLNQTPLNELTRSGHREAPSQQGPTSSANKQHNSAKNDRVNGQSCKGNEATLSTTNRNKVATNSEKSSTPGSIKVAEKPTTVPTQPTTFMPPNDDLRNKVKASLKMMAATKDQVPVKKTVPTEPVVPSSPQRQRESRVPATEGTSPSTRHGIRVAAGSQRRASQSSNPATNDSNPLEGIGFIQNTSTEPSASDQVIKLVSKFNISNSNNVFFLSRRLKSLVLIREVMGKHRKANRHFQKNI